MVGSTVAHFEIVEHLGRGGMGDVYRARDLLLDRDVALKFLAPTFQADSHRLERFKQEAKSVSSLDHPNICTIYEIGTGTNGVPFIAMAYYAGETLRSRIDRGPLTTDESVALAIQMLRGLGQAHKRGIVHRDVKPSNLILTGDGLLKILDFGIAKLRRDQTVTATQGFTGTIPYMSPEQLAGKIDERSDLWSTGVVLYEMLTGRLPFEGDSAGEVVQRILNEEPQDIQIFRTGIPEDFRRVLSRALEKSPKDRYQTAEAMIGELRPAGSFDGRNPTVHERPATERRVLGAAAGGPSVAVLPFTTFGRSEEAEYFSDGVTEDIIHALSRLRGIRVVSRTSAFEFKGKAQDVRQIATRLGVNNVLEGSVRLSNNKLRVTVLLTNARDGCSLWSQRFDRDLADVFSIQEEIATSIATRLCTTLTVESAGRLSLRPNCNVESWNLCLKARHHWHQARPESFEKARSLYEGALQVDPQCGAAYAGLADYHRALAFWGFVDPRQAWHAARSFSVKAIDLDPLLPQPHITMARYLQHMERNRTAAQHEFRRAIELNPGDSDTHVGWGVFLVQDARFDEALFELRLARDLDPLNLLIAVGVAWLHCYRGEYDHALAECLKARELNPNYVETFGCMAWIAEAQGRIDEAESWHERAVNESARAPISLAMLGRHYALYGKAMKAREMLAILRELSTKRYVSPIVFAFVHAALGEIDAALDHFEGAYEAHDALMSYAKVYPPFRPVLAEPRFERLLRGLGLVRSPEAPTDTAVSETAGD